MITIEVAYALEDEQTLLNFKVKKGTTLKQAIEISGILNKHPDISFAKNKTGIFGKITSLDTVLRAKDRVEIYRPLIADPKKIRRERAAQGKITRNIKKPN